MHVRYYPENPPYFCRKIATVMIYQKIFITERNIKKALETDMKKMETLESIKELLNQVDSSAEIIPASSPERLYLLLKDLKGSDLTRQEKQMMNEILRA